MPGLFDSEVVSILNGEEEVLGENPSALIYDCEIEKAILGRDEMMIPGIQYCEGWTDYIGMGITVIGCYDYMTGELLHFLRHELQEFADLVSKRKHIIGFNSKRFDDKLLQAHGVSIETTYDLLPVLKDACLPLLGKGKFTFKLDAFSHSNGFLVKSMQGGEAPVRWQQGAYEDVIEYCKGDVFRVKQMLDAEEIIEPNMGHRVKIRRPF